MKLKHILPATIMGLCLLASSCYDDKGNYDYDTLNDVDINVKMETTRYVLGEVIKITPVLNFTFGKATNELTYKWTFDKKVISTEKDLNWVVDELGNSKHLQLEVKDETTGITYYGSEIISVTSPYVGDGWLVLSEKDNKSVLTYLRQNTEDGKMKCIVTRDIYSLINQEPLGSQPTHMSVHYVNMWNSEDVTGWVWVSQKGGQGCVDLSGSSYRREGLLPSMFLAGHYPDHFTPNAVFDLRMLTLAVGEDGSIYTRVKENDLLFNSGYFLGDRPLTYTKSTTDGKTVSNKVDGTHLAMAPFADHGGILLYDKNSSEYLHVCDARDSYISWQTGNLVINAVYSGKVLPLTVDEKAYKRVPEFTRLDQMKDHKLHYVGSYRTEDYGTTGYMSVIEKGGVFYLQNFKVSDFDIYSPDVMGAEPISQEEIFSMGSYVDGISKNIFALSRYQNKVPGLFFTKGNDLYMLYLKGQTLTPVLFAHFDAPIASIDLENTFSKYLSVGLENGEFYIMSLNLSVIEDVLKTGPVRPSDGVDNKKVLFHEKDLGKIIQVLFKNPSNTGDWSWDLE